jgi:hypothetical protein
MPAPARGREEQGGVSRETALARLNPVDRPIDPPSAQPIAGGMLEPPGVTGGGVWVRATRPELKRIEGIASKARE